MLGKSQLKYIQSLGQKKHRDAEGLFVAEGPKIVTEWLDTPGIEIRKIFATQEWFDNNDPLGIETIPVTEDELAKISQLQTANQVLAVIKKWEEPRQLMTKAVLTLALDTIQDPGNLGTILRIADWFGIRQIVCSKDCADIYNPKVVQSSMGSLARVKCLYTDLDSWLSAQKETKIYAAALDGEDVTSMGKIAEGIIVIGNESKGISKEVAAVVNTRITIPKKGQAESLNAAVATGIILSHITR